MKDSVPSVQSVVVISPLSASCAVASATVVELCSYLTFVRSICFAYVYVVYFNPLSAQGVLIWAQVVTIVV